MKQWYEELFENYAEGYDREVFTRGTTGEVDFIEAEAGGDRRKKILDLGCGTGRHAVELAKRGFEVTGLDLSENQLGRARTKAARAGVKVDFIRADACDFRMDGAFDLVIMLCEGAFPLMETDAMNFRILENATRALKPGGKLIFTTLNALFPLFHSVKDFLNANGQRTQGNTFDLMTFRDHSSTEITDDDGRTKTVVSDERFYTPSEITWLLQSLGYRTIDIHGAKIGQFSRADTLTTEDFEMLVIAEK
ncbi:MAG: class I SAM-dependent methyltransferase [Candidatus Aminicenantales bacterium]